MIFGPSDGGSIRSVELLKRQRNEIFEALAANGVDPQNCTLTQRRSLSEPNPGPITEVVIHHKPTGSKFWIINDGSGLYPAAMTVGDADQAFRPQCDWAETLSMIAAWAGELGYEIDTPDLWAELQQVPEILAAAQSAEGTNAPFTPDEQAAIWRRLDDVKQLVREQFELPAEQLAAIDQRLDDAGKASKRLGRKDWLMAFYGAVMSTFMTDAIPPHVIQTIVTTVLHGVGHIFGFGGPPPIIST